jgi:hypothetical protein
MGELFLSWKNGESLALFENTNLDLEKICDGRMTFAAVLKSACIAGNTQLIHALLEYGAESQRVMLHFVYGSFFQRFHTKLLQLGVELKVLKKRHAANGTCYGFARTGSYYFWESMLGHENEGLKKYFKIILALSTMMHLFGLDLENVEQKVILPLVTDFLRRVKKLHSEQNKKHPRSYKETSNRKPYASCVGVYSYDDMRKYFHLLI